MSGDRANTSTFLVLQKTRIKLIQDNHGDGNKKSDEPVSYLSAALDGVAEDECAQQTRSPLKLGHQCLALPYSACSHMTRSGTTAILL